MQFKGKEWFSWRRWRISVGDIVIIKNDKTNRNFWKLAMVENLLLGEDNMARAAVLKVVGGKGDQIQRLRRLKFVLKNDKIVMCVIMIAMSRTKKQPRTQGSIYAPVALPLRKNPGPGWSRASQNMGSSIN